MTVAELINELQTMPPDALVYAEGEMADKVILEKCDGNQYVRIFKAWEVEFTGIFDFLDKVSEAIREKCDNDYDCEHCDWVECPIESEK